jgi:hypothetical protein
VAAWALNQLARRCRRDVDLLLDAGHRLREAQAGVLAGAARDAFEQARKTEREALSRLTREAEKLLSERGSASAATLAQVGESLRAAAISEEGRALLARGRFVQPLRAQGFDVVGALAATAPQAERPLRKDAAAAGERKKAERALRAAKDDLRASQRTAHEAAREAARLRRDAESADRRADEARASAVAAARAVEEAEERVSRTRRG